MIHARKGYGAINFDFLRRDIRCYAAPRERTRVVRPDRSRLWHRWEPGSRFTSCGRVVGHPDRATTKIGYATCDDCQMRKGDR